MTSTNARNGSPRSPRRAAAAARDRDPADSAGSQREPAGGASERGRDGAAGSGRNGVKGTGNGASRRAAAPAAPQPAAGSADDTSSAGLLAALDDADRMRTLAAKMSFMARTRYGIRSHDAEDIFHEAVVTYLSIRGRFPPGDNHFGILVGIYQKKALEYLGATRRVGRVAERLAARLRAERPPIARGEDPSGNVADRVIRDEDAALIRTAIRTLSPEGRELLLELAEGELTRLEAIARLGLNANTFDTRIRTLRLRLRSVLEDAGVL